jgi:hypothetical protein
VISTRYVLPVLVLLLLALVPTAIHSYAGLVVDDGRRASALPTTLDTFVSKPSSRNATWGKRRFDSTDWIEREYQVGGHDVILTVVRSYDLKALYHHPELAVAYHEGHTFEPERTMRFSGRQSVAVHVLRATPPDDAMAMYALYYDGEYIDNPIVFQLRTAAELVFSGRKAMTLFFVQDASVPASADLSTAPPTRLLFAALDHFAAPDSAR